MLHGIVRDLVTTAFIAAFVAVLASALIVRIWEHF
jgi:hypothetical protein